MQKRVVAISTTHGSEGRRIGGLVAQLLEFGYVDEQIITIAAEKRGIDPEVVADAEKRKSLVLRVLEGLGEGGSGGHRARSAAGRCGSRTTRPSTRGATTCVR